MALHQNPCRRFVVSIRQSRPLTKFEKMWNSPCIAIEVREHQVHTANPSRILSS